MGAPGPSRLFFNTFTQGMHDPMQGVANPVSVSEVGEANPFDGSEPSAEGAAALSELNQAVEENRMQRLKRREVRWQILLDLRLLNCFPTEPANRWNRSFS